MLSTFTCALKFNDVICAYTYSSRYANVPVTSTTFKIKSKDTEPNASQQVTWGNKLGTESIFIYLTLTALHRQCKALYSIVYCLYLFTQQSSTCLIDVTSLIAVVRCIFTHEVCRVQGFAFQLKVWSLSVGKFYSTLKNNVLMF